MTKRHYQRATGFRPFSSIPVMEQRQIMEGAGFYKILWISDSIEVREVAKKTLMIYVSPSGFKNIWEGAMSCKLRGRSDREMRQGVMTLIGMMGKSEPAFARALAALLRRRCGAGIAARLAEIGAKTGDEQ